MARQDLEIIYNPIRKIPTLYTMTHPDCRHGLRLRRTSRLWSSGGRHLQNQVDKSNQFTDWSHRPLSQKQLAYALDDVIHLVDIYLHLEEHLIQKKPSQWVSGEVSALTSRLYTKLIHTKHGTAWKSITKNQKGFSCIARIGCMANNFHRKDVPRSASWKTKLDWLCLSTPTNENRTRIRGISADMAKGIREDGNGYVITKVWPFRIHTVRRTSKTSSAKFAPVLKF